MKDYYKILDLQRDANITQIRTSYRRLALKLHPDVNESNSANEEFLEISEAYHVLKNIHKRARYNRLFDDHSDQKSDNNNGHNFKKKAEQNAKRDSQMKDIKFEKKTKRSGLFDRIVVIFEFIVNIFSLF